MMTMTAPTRQVATERIAELQAELAQAEANLRQFDALTPLQQFATDLHELTCHQEHTETCGWYYEKWDQEKHWTRTRYLEKARAILAITDAATATAVLAAAEKF